MESKRTTDESTDRGVSPVIGVILMVAITVILAAVIAAFVLDIGPSETEPTAVVEIDGSGTENVDVELVSVSQGDGIAVVPNDADITDHDDDDLEDINIAQNSDDEGVYVASQSITGATISLDGDDNDNFDIEAGTYEFAVVAYDGEDPVELVDHDESDLDGDEIIGELDDDGSVNIVLEEDFEIEVTD